MRKLFLVFLFALSGTAVSVAQQVQVETLQQSGSPVRIIHANLQNFQFTSHLEMLISQTVNGPVSETEFRLYIIHGTEVTAGEGWVNHGSLEAGLVRRTSAMHLASGDRAFLVIVKASTDQGAYTANPDSIIKAVKDAAEGKQGIVLQSRGFNLKPRLVFSAFQTTTTFCQGALADAKGTCSAGVQSFSCDEKNQTFSFTCRGPAPVQE